MNVLSVSNQKGGVGKTTISINLAYLLAELKYKTLLIDLDPQGHSSLIYNRFGLPDYYIDLLFSEKNIPIEYCIKPAYNHIGDVIENLWIAPSSIKLAMASELASNRFRRENILHNHLKNLSKGKHFDDTESFDLVIIDCPPNLGVLSINAIYASDHILIPTNYGRFATEGMTDLISVISEIKEVNEYSDDINYSIIRNAVDARTTSTNRIIDYTLESSNLFKSQILRTIIRRCEAINKAQINEQPLFTFDKKSPAVADFENLTFEILRRVNYEKQHN